MDDTTFTPSGSGVKTMRVGDVALASVERPTSVEAQTLERDYGVDRSDLDLAMARTTPPGLMRRAGYVVICAPVPVVAPRTETLSVTPVSFIVGRDFLLLVHAGEARPILRFLRQLETDEAFRANAGTGGLESLLARCYERLLDVAVAAHARIERRTAEEEEALARGDARTNRALSRLVRLRGEVRLASRLVVPLTTIGRGAAELGLPSAEWERAISRATRLAEVAADDLAAQDGLLLAYAAASSAQTARHVRGLLAVAALTLPILAMAVLVSLPYGNPLATAPAGSAFALALVGLIFVVSLYVLRRNELL